MNSSRVLKCMVLAAFCVLVFTKPVASVEISELLQSLLEQNEASWNSIQSVSYGINAQSEVGDESTISQSGRVIRKGNSHWSTIRQATSSTAAEQMSNAESRIVVNDKYMAFWSSTEKRLAHRHDHASIKDMSEQAKELLAANLPPEHFLHYCFGGPHKHLKAMVEQSPEYIEWDAIKVKDVEGNIVYHVRRFTKETMEDGSMPDMVWVLDPEKGYMAKETTSYIPNGALRMHRTMQIEEATKGVWFPIAYEHERYDSTQDSLETQTVNQRISIALKDVRVNMPITAEQFEIAALELNKNVRVLRTGLDGKTTAYVFAGKMLIPAEVTYSKPISEKVEKSSFTTSDTPTAVKTTKITTARRSNRLIVSLIAAGILIIVMGFSVLTVMKAQSKN
jgi:hypothetical protein